MRMEIKGGKGRRLRGKRGEKGDTRQRGRDQYHTVMQQKERNLEREREREKEREREEGG